MLRNFCWHTKHHIYRAIWNTCLYQGSGNGDRGTGCFFTRLDDNRTTSGQRASYFAHNIKRWEVPSNKGDNRANGIFADGLGNASHAWQHGATIDALTFFAVPADNINSNAQFKLGFGQRLTHLFG